MKPAPFEYVRPGSLPEALDALARHGPAGRILAGGQSLVPMMNLRLVKPAVLIDINRVPGLADVRVDGGELVIGALARHAALLASEIVAAHCPLMVEAYACVAHGPIRNRGTLGGNISHADPASEMPAVLAACDAKIGVRSAKGARTIPATEFFTGALSTGLAEGEMVTEIRIPTVKSGQGAAWREAANRQGDFAMAGVAALVTVAGGKCTHASVAVAGMERPGLRLPAVEKQLVGTTLDAAAITAAAAMASEVVRPSGSYHADPIYKRELAETLTARAVTAARDRAR
ncbi:MAG TPA: xanthine dehydrogenase family protein subunit M [Burkholderiales bacterium]|nr:xanthine dehydrogenase family protein subunit M [Burkholderiales bacterium]